MKLAGFKFVFFFTLSLVLNAGMCAMALADEKVLTVGTSGAYYPITFIENEKPMGLEVDVWNEIGKRIGYSIEYEHSNFSGLFGMLDAGRIDTVANNINISPARREKYYFTAPYMTENLRLVVAKDSAITSLKDLKGKTVAANVGTTDLQILEDSLKKLGLDKDVKVLSYDNNAAMRDVDLGRIAACVDSEAHTASQITKAGLNLKLVGEPLAASPIGYPFLKNDKNRELIAKIDQALSEMKKDGTLSQICAKWVGEDISYK